MSIADFYRSLGVTPAVPATDSEIVAAEKRLKGKLPETLRKWFLDADGFCGEAETLHWRFKSLGRLCTIEEYFPGVDSLEIRDVYSPGAPPRIVPATNYVIFCDCLINLPFYATNVAPADAHFGEIICADEEAPSQAVIAAANFDQFGDYLRIEYEDPIIIVPPGRREPTH